MGDAMTIRLTCVEGGSNKFWAAEVQGVRLVVRFGKVGTDGQTSIKDFASPAAAKAELDKRQAEKLKKGYQPDGGEKPKPAKPVKPVKPAGVTIVARVPKPLPKPYAAARPLTKALKSLDWSSPGAGPYVFGLKVSKAGRWEVWIGAGSAVAPVAPPLLGMRLMWSYRADGTATIQCPTIGGAVVEVDLVERSWRKLHDADTCCDVTWVDGGFALLTDATLELHAIEDGRAVLRSTYPVNQPSRLSSVLGDRVLIVKTEVEAVRSIVLAVDQLVLRPLAIIPGVVLGDALERDGRVFFEREDGSGSFVEVMELEAARQAAMAVPPPRKLDLRKLDPALVIVVEA